MTSTPHGSGAKRLKKRAPGNAAFHDLLTVINLRPKYLWWGEVVLALAGGAGGGWLGHDRIEEAHAAARVAAPLIGIIIGAVVAALAMITRALDTAFLKKAKAAGITPMSKYFSPFITIITLGLLAGVSLLLLSATKQCGNGWSTAFGAAAGLFTLWTLAGLLPALGTLIQFTQLLEKTAGIPEPKE